MLTSKKTLWNFGCIALMVVALCFPVLSHAQSFCTGQKHIVTADGNFALSTDGQHQDGDLVDVRPDTGDEDQTWTMSFQVGNGTDCIAIIQSVSALGKNLDCNGTCAKGNHPQLWENNGNANQLWLIVPVANVSSQYVLFSRGSVNGTVLDATADPDSGTEPHMWPSNGTDAQFWKIN